MEKKVIILVFIFFILLSGITGKTFYEQIIMGPDYAVQSLEMRTKQFPLEQYPRGDILDCNGISLSDSAYRPSVLIFPRLISEPERLLARFKQDLPQINIRLEDIKPYYKNNNKIYPEPFVLKIQDNRIFSIISSWKEPGVTIVPYKMRYGSNALAVHLVGYMGYPQNGYLPQGMTGIEKRLNDVLSGERPEKIVAPVTDARNHILEGLGFRLFELGKDHARKDIILSIDARIQRLVEEVLEEKGIIKGSVVILDVNSGNILAAASRPKYDPNNLKNNMGFSDNQIERIIDYKVYPGSIFKVITAAAALEEGIVNPETKFVCTGSSSDFRVQCPRPHGEITFSQAMERSCNVTFVQIGLELGRKKLEEYMISKFGFNPIANKALDSSEAIAHGVIGQVIFQVSPLEIANMMATIARDGYHQELSNPWETRLIQATRTSEGQIENFTQLPSYKKLYSNQTAQFLKQMLTMTNQQGSGRRAWLENYGSAGKTGTPQTNGLGAYMAWYTGYAPSDNPRYAVSVLIEEIAGVNNNELQGGYHAGPVFKEILERIFQAS
ncbi:MAG: peptidoglycan D,D-transpeptidase FtsI family protein, partial [Peptococcales bacterium]